MPSLKSSGRVRYLTGEEILYIHYRIIGEIGGAHGVRDISLFLSTLERPRTIVADKEQFSSLFFKAAVYLESFTQYQIFIDGNKRTGLASAVRFLSLNGIALNASDEAIEILVMEAAAKKIGVVEIAEWLEKNSNDRQRV